MKLQSAVRIAAIKAAYTQLKTTTESSIRLTAGIFQSDPISFSVATLNRILMEAEQGYFVTFTQRFDEVFAADGAGASDGAVLEFFKTLTDDAAVAENATNQFMKALANTAGASDNLTFALGRNFQNLSVIEEAYAAHFQKPRSDAFSVSDTLEPFLFGKNPSDTPVFADALRKDMTRIIGDDTDQDYVTDGYFWDDYVEGPRTEILAVFDVFAPTVAKPFSDSAAASESLYRQVDFSRSFTDTVNVTDDVDGLASILDDQEMQFVKFSNETASVSETFARAVAYSRAYSDTYAVTDSEVHSVGKGLSETPALSEDTAFATGKSLTDTPVLTDALATGFGRPLTDNYSVTDDDDLSVGKGLEDTASLTDAGSLRSQGYVDFTYFAEDYVGASRTF